ncbi:zinc finger MYM-type protein 1-like protein [Tanacetum coccineum]
MLRSDGWESLFKEVSTFCRKYNMAIPKMDDAYELPGRPRRLAHKVTLLHHYQIEIFKAVIDWVLQEYNNMFNEVKTELLVCMGCLRPNDSFLAFNKDKLVRLAKLYPSSYSELDRVYLDVELETFLFDMKTNSKFPQLKGIERLASKLVKKKKHIIYHLIYPLIKLVLVLPVSTASVEKSHFSAAMKYCKTRLGDLRNQNRRERKNECLLAMKDAKVKWWFLGRQWRKEKRRALSNLLNACGFEIFSTLQSWKRMDRLYRRIWPKKVCAGMICAVNFLTSLLISLPFLVGRFGQRRCAFP